MYVRIALRKALHNYHHRQLVSEGYTIYVIIVISMNVRRYSQLYMLQLYIQQLLASYVATQLKVQLYKYYDMLECSSQLANYPMNIQRQISMELFIQILMFKVQLASNSLIHRQLCHLLQGATKVSYMRSLISDFQVLYLSMYMATYVGKLEQISKYTMFSGIQLYIRYTMSNCMMPDNRVSVNYVAIVMSYVAMHVAKQLDVFNSMYVRILVSQLSQYVQKENHC